MTDTPIAVDLDQFLNLPIEDKPPLLGIEGQSAIVAGGLVLLGGQAGLGKTTLIVDAIFHMASGRDWLNFTVGRPLNILVIENEGPLRMFQQKLAAKRQVWQHDLQGQIHVQTAAWGWFSFADLDHHARIRAYLDDNQIDLVVGDPIGTLGMEGVGSPEDTRTFVRLLVPLGLFDHRAFIFPVHFTKEPRKDEINQISGAWGGHLDTLMVLKATRRKDELRLSFPKLRWWNTETPKPMILGKIYNTQTFEILRHEGDTEPLEDRIIELLDRSPWLTAREIANKDTGIDGGARLTDVKTLLEARTDLFRWEGGADHGRHATAIVWELIPLDGNTSRDETAQQSQKELFPETGNTQEHLGTPTQAEKVFPALGTPGNTHSNNDSGEPEEGVPTTRPLRGDGNTSPTPAPKVFPQTGNTSTPTDRWHEAETLIRDGGWMEPIEQILETILTRWPLIPISKLNDLRLLHTELAAAEAGDADDVPS